MDSVEQELGQGTVEGGSRCLEPQLKVFHSHVWQLVLAADWTSACGLGFLTTWWLGSKGKHPNRKRAKWKREVSQPHFILLVRGESLRPAHIPGEEKSGSTSYERRVKEFMDMFLKPS